MTKKEIVRTISEEIGLTQLKTKEIVQKTFDAIVEKLEEMGLLERIEEHLNALGRCHRCHTVLAAPARRAGGLTLLIALVSAGLIAVDVFIGDAWNVYE